VGRIKGKSKRGWREIRIPASPARYSSNLLIFTAYVAAFLRPA
jgi:hypothetical protein